MVMVNLDSLLVTMHSIQIMVHTVQVLDAMVVFGQVEIQKMVMEIQDTCIILLKIIVTKDMLVDYNTLLKKLRKLIRALELMRNQ